MKSKAVFVTAVVATLQVLSSGAARAQEIPPPEIVADQIRDQGFPCSKALTAERDATYSTPDVPVWILTCDNATYRVWLVPGVAADVVRLNK